MQTQGGHRRSAPGRAELDTSSPQLLSGDRPAGPRPGPPRRVFGEIQSEALKATPAVGAWTPAPELAARHDRRARVPQRGRSPPGAVACPGSDRKSCHFSGTAFPGAEPGFRSQESLGPVLVRS